MSVLGLTGILVFLAGVHLLWQARKDVLYWMQEFFWILRREFSRRGGLVEDTREVAEVCPDAPGQGAPAAAGSSAADRARVRRKPPSGTLRLLGGFGLMVLGQVLLLLDLTL